MTDKIIPEYSSNQIDIPKFNFGELVQKVEIGIIPGDNPRVDSGIGILFKNRFKSYSGLV